MFISKLNNLIPPYFFSLWFSPINFVWNIRFLNIHKYLAGHLGGEKQLGAQIENNDIDLVIFLRDPLTPKSHEPEVTTLFQLCDVHNIPLATNVATAELLVKALERGDLDWRELVRQ